MCGAAVVGLMRKKKCKKVNYFCKLFCRLKKKCYLCVNNKGKGLHPIERPKVKQEGVSPPHKQSKAGAPAHVWKV